MPNPRRIADDVRRHRDAGGDFRAAEAEPPTSSHSLRDRFEPEAQPPGAPPTPTTEAMQLACDLNGGPPPKPKHTHGRDAQASKLHAATHPAAAAEARRDDGARARKQPARPVSAPGGGRRALATSRNPGDPRGRGQQQASAVAERRNPAAAGDGYQFVTAYQLKELGAMDLVGTQYVRPTARGYSMCKRLHERIQAEQKQQGAASPEKCGASAVSTAVDSLDATLTASADTSADTASIAPYAAAPAAPPSNHIMACWRSSMQVASSGAARFFVEQATHITEQGDESLDAMAGEPSFIDALQRQGLVLQDLREDSPLPARRRAALLAAVLQEQATQKTMPPPPVKGAQTLKKQLLEDHQERLRRMQAKQGHQQEVLQRCDEVLGHRSQYLADKARQKEEWAQVVAARETAEEEQRRARLQEKTSRWETILQQAEDIDHARREDRQAFLGAQDARMRESLERRAEEQERQRSKLQERFQYICERAQYAQELEKEKAQQQAAWNDAMIQRSLAHMDEHRQRQEKEKEEWNERKREKEHQALRVARMKAHALNQKQLEIQEDIDAFEECCRLRQTMEGERKYMASSSSNKELLRRSNSYYKALEATYHPDAFAADALATDHLEQHHPANSQTPRTLLPSPSAGTGEQPQTFSGEAETYLLQQALGRGTTGIARMLREQRALACDIQASYAFTGSASPLDYDPGFTQTLGIPSSYGNACLGGGGAKCLVPQQQLV